MSKIANMTSADFWRPSVIRDITAYTADQGLVSAAHTVLEQSNVHVDIDGDYERLQQHKGGLLLVGDHSHQWEFVAAMDMLHDLDRPDMLNVAKFYVQRQVRQVLGGVAAASMVPVYPRLLARDRLPKVNKESLNRLVYHTSLLTLDESERANKNSLLTAARWLEDDGTVNIFPCGSIVDATKKPWRSGVGDIISTLPAEAHENVLICPYRVEGIHRARLVARLAMRGKGFHHPVQLTLQLGNIQSVTEFLAPLSDAQRHNPILITAALRHNFIDYFATLDAGS